MSINWFLPRLLLLRLLLPRLLFAQASTEASTEVSTEAATPESNDSLNLTPEVIEQSPVLQRWQEAVPNVRADIQNDPSFKTRIYAGYSAFPSTEGKGGFAVGVEDWFVGDLPLTGERLTISRLLMAIAWPMALIRTTTRCP